jgi:hypothetical protein
LILLVANGRRASFRLYRSTSFSRKVAQKSRTQMRESRSAKLAALQAIGLRRKLREITDPVKAAGNISGRSPAFSAGRD